MMRSVGFKAHRAFSRRFGTGFPVTISEEVRQALNDKVPVVSLESTIVTHGLPYPANLEMARDVEAVIRENGCVPATVAFIDGVPSVGLNDSTLEKLSTAKNVHKTSRRDIPYVMSERLMGGTTISSTMILSKLAGIKVFATGGLGGVHKHGESTMDVSADLDELSKTDVAVVCSGPKAILDIERTLEYLETKGVPVTTFNPKSKSEVYIPGFYCEESTVLSPFSFTSFDQPANMIHKGLQMGLGNGYLICIPPPDHLALDKEFIYKVIDEAQFEAEKLGIKGKNVTPFLLGKINAETNGKSVKSNVGFVLNNARSASQIAKKLNQLENEGSHTFTFQPSTKIAKTKITAQSSSSKVADKCTSLIIGSIAVDSTCVLKPGYKLKDSNPGLSRQTIGGVGYNVTLSTHFSSRDVQENDNCRLVSIIAKDTMGDKILKDLESKQIDNSGILTTDQDLNTAQYISIHGDDGSLLVACADMDIIESINNEHIIRELKRARPEYVLIDCNITVENMDCILIQSKELGFKIVMEPTSIIKASRITKSKKIDVWPNNQLIMSSPTIEELNTIYEGFEENEKFDDIEGWFNILDKLGLDSTFNNELSAKGNKDPVIKKMLQEGVFQKAFKILPFIPCLVVKDGKNGILVIQIVDNAHELTKSTLSATDASFSALTKNGKEYYDSQNVLHKLGVLIQHYTIPAVIDPSEIKNVTGAGDSLIGYLFNKLVHGSDFLKSVDYKRDLAFKNCQTAAGLSLKCEDAVNIKEIAKIE